MAKDKTAYKVQLLDEYNNPYSPITSIYSLYYIKDPDNDSPVRKSPKLISDISIGTYSNTSTSTIRTIIPSILLSNDIATIQYDGDSLLEQCVIKSMGLSDALLTDTVSSTLGSIIQDYLTNNLSDLGIQWNMPSCSSVGTSANYPKYDVDIISKTNSQGEQKYKLQFGNEYWRGSIMYPQPNISSISKYPAISWRNTDRQHNLTWPTLATEYIPSINIVTGGIEPNSSNPNLFYSNHLAYTTTAFSSAISYTEENQPDSPYLQDTQSIIAQSQRNRTTVQYLAWVKDVDALGKTIYNRLNNNYLSGDSSFIKITNTGTQNKIINLKLASSKSALCASTNGGLMVNTDGYTINVNNNNQLYVDTQNVKPEITINGSNGIRTSNNPGSSTVSIDDAYFTCNSDNIVFRKNFRATQYNIVIDVSGNITSKGNIALSNGDVTAVAFYATSDITKKENIKDIADSADIPRVVEFNWKSTGKKSYGFIAQELNEKYPELIKEDSKGIMHVDYMATLSLMIGKMQNRIDALEKRIKELESK